MITQTLGAPHAPLAIRNDDMPTPQELMVYQTWAKSAFDSQLYRNIGKESAIMMIMLAAREYGIGPVQALNGGIHIIDGKVELSARVMSALIRRARHTLKIQESTEEKCTIYGKRYDTGEDHTVTFTMEMATKAGLIKDKGGWKKTPEDMLFARAISRLARQLFSDVVGIGYVEGEIIDSVANKGHSERSEMLPPDMLQLEAQDQEAQDQEIKNLEREFSQHFSEEDKPLLPGFISQLIEVYKIEHLECIKKLLIDIPASTVRFNSWKSRKV